MTAAALGPLSTCDKSFVEPSTALAWQHKHVCGCEKIGIKLRQHIDQAFSIASRAKFANRVSACLVAVFVWSNLAFLPSMTDFRSSQLTVNVVRLGTLPSGSETTGPCVCLLRIFPPASENLAKVSAAVLGKQNARHGSKRVFPSLSLLLEY